MKKCCLLITILLMSCNIVMGQSLFGDQKPIPKVFNVQRSKTVVQPSKTFRTSRQNPAVDIIVTEKKDTACYLELTKRFGWYEGIGRKLTKEEICHLPCYYRLTESDSLGHFTHIEAVNGRGLLTTHHNMSTYLVGHDDDNDLGADSIWKKMLQTVVQWELIPAGDNRYVAMESGLDADGNLIYTYIISKLNDSTMVGHYTDAFGEPISLRKESDAAKNIQVILDKQGYERQILYIDDNAYFKRNTDEAYMQKKDYDAQGNIVRLLSCMMDGRPVKDKWGNCGWTADYNEWGQMLHKRYIDENMQPMRMPRQIKTSVDVMSRNFNYDSLRLQREFYLTADGEKDQTKEGVHSREWQYDVWGNVLCEKSKDKNGRLCNDRRGIAQTFYTYDKLCRETSRYYTDKDGRYVNDEDSLCMYRGMDTYRTSNGLDTIPVYKMIVSGLETKFINYDKQQIKVIKTDRQGRETESAYYDLAYQPIEVDSCFRLTTVYRTENHKQIKEEMRYSFKDTIRTITETDTKELTRLVQRFHGTKLLSRFGQTLNSDMEVTGQFGYDALGNRARSHLEDALYFRVKSGVTYRGDNSYIMGRNEYGEPSYVVTSESRNSEIYCTKLFDANGKRILLDENNQPIDKDSLAKFRDSRNRVYCVEVITPRARQLGLCSGDIIVKYGDFYYPQANNEVWKYRDWLQMDTYLSRNNKKDVLLLRYDDKLRHHKMVNLTLPAGTEEELGFLIQTVYYTQKETDRYNNYVQQWLHDHGLKQEDFEINEKHYGTHQVNMIRPFKISAAKMSSWQAGLHEDGLVVAVVSLNQDGSRMYAGIGDGEKKVWNLLTGKCDSVTIYYTTNGIRLRQAVLPYNGSARSASFSKLPTGEFNRLLELEETSIPQAYRDSLVKSKSLLTPEQAHRYMRRHASSESGFRYDENDSKFHDILRILSNHTGVNVKECGMTSLMGVWEDSKTNDEDKKLMSNIFKRIDFSRYEQEQANGFTIYYRRSDTSSDKLSEYVIVGKTYLFIFKGLITLSIDAIKEGSYEKIH